MRFCTPGHLARASLCAALASLPAGCASDPQDDPSAVTIGLLLPFTGSESATASNFERAVLYARDRINAAGWVKGRRVRVISADTHSDARRSTESVKQLIEQGALVVIGPESAEIAAEIRPILDDKSVILLSPLVGAADDTTVDCAHPWFRLAPSARTLGEALAKEMVARKITRAAILHSNEEYDVALRDAVSKRFVSLGGKITFDVSLDPAAQSYAATLHDELDDGVDTIVLASSPRSAALTVNELAALSTTQPRLFLSPLLKTELLVQNVAPEALEGAVGVAPKIYDTSKEFPEAFGDRWLGDQPLEGAYFYYDAMALLAFALEKSTLRDGKLDPAQVESAILAAAGPPGEPHGWNDLDAGLERLRAQDPIYYSGLTGPMLLTTCGARRLGTSSTWSVHAGAISEIIEK